MIIYGNSNVRIWRHKNRPTNFSHFEQQMRQLKQRRRRGDGGSGGGGGVDGDGGTDISLVTGKERETEEERTREAEREAEKRVQSLTSIGDRSHYYCMWFNLQRGTTSTSVHTSSNTSATTKRRRRRRRRNGGEGEAGETEERRQNGGASDQKWTVVLLIGCETVRMAAPTLINAQLICTLPSTATTTTTTTNRWIERTKEPTTGKHTCTRKTPSSQQKSQKNMTGTRQ